MYPSNKGFQTFICYKARNLVSAGNSLHYILQNKTILKEHKQIFHKFRVTVANTEKQIGSSRC